MFKSDSIRILLVGTPGTEIRLAAEMARNAGAEVATADTVAQALEMLLRCSAALIMIDLALDVPVFIARLRADRLAVPVFACGVDAPATLAVAAIRAGARDYVPLPPQRDLIAAAISSVAAHSPDRMVGDHPALQRAMGIARAAAHSRAPLLISGEKGTGKEVLARFVHHASARPGPFLVVDCAGVTPEVLESEIFGHEAEAFSGATARRIGGFEKARNGTLFLRAVDRLPAAVQAKLLSVLQSGAVRRLGGGELVPVSARLIASTSADLAASAADGAFCTDLLARLALVQVTAPSLRERASDIPVLAQHLAERLALANFLPVRRFSDEAVALLASHCWPGNVWELEDVVHRAIRLSSDAAVGCDAIVLMNGSRLDPHASQTSTAPAEIEKLVGRTVEEVERELILQTLRRCQGNRTSASSILGISVRTMRNKLKSFIEAGIAVAPAA